MLDKGTCLRFYKRRDIQEALVAHSSDKEVGMRFGESFGKRPDILNYPRDVLELALKGVTSFHASEELWSNPLSLDSNVSKKELDELRKGWDLVLDIDCAFIEYSKICADLIVEFLEYCEVKDFSVKFSGNKGFHIGIPFEAFPKQVGELPTKLLFPEAPRKIAFYVKENIKEELSKRILELEKGDFLTIKEKVNLPQEDIIRYEISPLGDSIPKLNIDKFLEIDTVLLSSRHLYRMPYSLHEKSGLASLPIDPHKILDFKKETAKPEAILSPIFVFLNRHATGESARRLLLQALDFKIKEEIEREETLPKKFEEMPLNSPIPQNFFPPCMIKMLGGMEDGKKRAVFCLMNYLGKIGWNKNEIETFLKKWNLEKNREPLREVYIKGQLTNFKPGERLPPNCDHEAYYKTLGVSCNAPWCRRLKNPVNYTLSKWRRYLHEKEEGKFEEKEKKSDSSKN